MNRNKISSISASGANQPTRVFATKPNLDVYTGGVAPQAMQSASNAQATAMSSSD
jgi:hypothetical protein